MKISTTLPCATLIAVVALLIVGELIASWINANKETEAASSQFVGLKKSTHDSDSAIERLKAKTATASLISSPLSTPQLVVTPVTERTLSVITNQEQLTANEGERNRSLVSANIATSIIKSVTLQQAKAQGLTSSVSLVGTEHSVNVRASSPLLISTLKASTVAPAETQTIPGVSIPAVFGNPEAVGIPVSSEQAQQIAVIANEFSKSVQSSGAVPNSTAYQSAWNSAASMADARYKQQYGWQAYEAMQRTLAAP